MSTVQLKDIETLLKEINQTLDDLRTQYPIPTPEALRIIDKNQISIKIFDRPYTDTVARSAAQDKLTTAEAERATVNGTDALMMESA